MIQDFKQFDLFGHVVFAKAIVKPPFRFTAEMPNDACFYYIISGENKMMTSESNIVLKADNGLVMQCGNYFADFLETQNEAHCEAIAIHFPVEVLRTIYDKELPDFVQNINQVEPIGYMKTTSSVMLKKYIESLKFYFDHPELVSEELLKLKLKELILLLAKTDKAGQISNYLSRLFTKTELKFNLLINEHLYDNLSVDDLATLSNLSLSTFKREFQKAYNDSPARYIRNKRLNKSAELLENTELRITDIAYDCGFSDVAHFSKSFHKAYSCSPSEYRLSQKHKSLNES